MRFNYRKNNSIPQASWCAILNTNSDIIDVELGRAVAHDSQFFVSGVWDGVFSEGTFEKAHFSCATGAKLIGGKSANWGGVIFSTPSHLLESLYSIRCKDTLYISNSLPFVLSRANASLDTGYMEYQRDLCSSMFGIKKQTTSSPLADNNILNYYRACNIKIDSDLNIKVEPRDSRLTFLNYEEYWDIVQEVMTRIKSNSVDSARNVTYDMISTISQGYDAVATSVIAKKIGCDRVLTFNKPEHYRKDCGTEIAEILGFNDIIEADANLYLTNEENIEASCIATGDVGSTIVFAAYKELFKNSLVFLGVRGDSLWERNHANVNNDQDFSDGNTLQQTDHSFIESCLDVNAVCIPVPMIASDRWGELTALSQSDDMKPWSIREKYDRPIPRRIAESAGVPRDSFGRAKSGAGISYHFDTFSRVMRKMSPRSARSLRAFKKNYNTISYQYIKQNIRFYLKEFPLYINYINSRLHIPIRLKRKESYISSPLSTILINWSIEEMKKKYN